MESSSFLDSVLSFLGCSYRATVRYIKGIPGKVKDSFNRKISEYTSRPKRKSINRIYVLVGYISKESADLKYKTERNLISLKRALLMLIFILLFVITIRWILPFVQLDQYKTMFGIDSVDQMTRNDPFTLENGNSYVDITSGQTEQIGG